MKRIFALMLISCVAYGQEYDIRPTVSTTTIASIVTKSGQDTLHSAAKAFGNVVVGQRVFGPGVLQGATVTALVDAALDSQIVISSNCTASATVSLQFGYFTSAIYGSGDWLGFPFEVIPASGAGGQLKLISAIITDAADVITATDIVFYKNLSGLAGGTGLDNAAAAELAANEWYILGIVSLTTITDLGAVKILTKDDINLTLPKGEAIWARLIARGTPTLTAVDNFRVRLRFQ